MLAISNFNSAKKFISPYKVIPEQVFGNDGHIFTAVIDKHTNIHSNLKFEWMLLCTFQCNICID